MRALLLSSFLLVGAALTHASGDPVAEVQKKDNALKAYLQKTKGQTLTKVQQDSLKQLINGIFDFSELGKRSLGKNWGDLNEAQQKDFIAVFKRMVENTSIKRLENYRSDSARYTVTGSGEKTIVKRRVSISSTSTVERLEKRINVHRSWRSFQARNAMRRRENGLRRRFEDLASAFCAFFLPLGNERSRKRPLPRHQDQKCASHEASLPHLTNNEKRHGHSASTTAKAPSQTISPRSCADASSGLHSLPCRRSSRTARGSS